MRKEIEKFYAERQARIASLPDEFRAIGTDITKRMFENRVMYNFDWMGRPIIQLPSDIVALQEIIWQVKPDLIIETGIAHGGSLIFSASQLALLEYCNAVEGGKLIDCGQPRGRVLGIDIDIRAHNREAIESHPMSNRIDMIQGSSISPDIVARVHDLASQSRSILVCLDSNHTHEHVLAELHAYAPLVEKHSYCVVFDTFIEDLPGDLFSDRPWAPGNNPKTAITEFMRQLEAGEVRGSDNEPLRFEIDKVIEDKILFTVAPGGYLKRV